MGKIGYCHFCKQSDVELHKKSHILPSFLFKNIYGDEGKRLIEVNSDSLEITSTHSDSPYEKWIFCKKCEQNHSVIESKAAHLLNHIKIDKSNISIRKSDVMQQYIIEGIKTEIIRKFWMLNLFRANLSNRPLFNMVNLGPYSEKFRLILTDQLDSDSVKLSIHIFNLKNLMKDLARLSSPLYKHKAGSKIAYSILIDGIGYFIHFGYPDVELFRKTHFENDGKATINVPDRKSGKIILEMLNFKKDWISNLP